jgi:hypothetical protein
MLSSAPRPAKFAVFVASFALIAFIAPPPLRAAPIGPSTEAQTALSSAGSIRSADSSRAPDPVLVSSDTSASLLDQQGQLIHPISQGDASTWTSDLRKAAPRSELAAELHLALGEYYLGQVRQPDSAIRQFALAEGSLPMQDPLYGRAEYESAEALFYEGAYREARDAFDDLTRKRYPANAFSRQQLVFWMRDASMCAGLHASHAIAGIPEPPRLDPFCGAASLAECLHILSLPWDKAAVVRSMRVTGEGSNLQDIIDAGPKLGASVRAVQATDEGLKLLPKPAIAYVEADHFVAVVSTDSRSVTYVCSDCGAWPGGRVTVTWKQWRLIRDGLYGIVTRPGSAWDNTMRVALAPAADRQRVISGLLASSRVASIGSLSGIGLKQILALPQSLMHTLEANVIADDTPAPAGCGTLPQPMICKPCDSTPMDGAGSPSGDPVDLAAGDENLQPPPDITVFNPHGPSVVWTRNYLSMRGPGQDKSFPGDNNNLNPNYESDDFGIGWSQSYNICVIDKFYNPSSPGYQTGTRQLQMPNGTLINFNFPSVPTPTSNPIVSAEPKGERMALEWVYVSSTS